MLQFYWFLNLYIVREKFVMEKSIQSKLHNEAAKILTWVSLYDVYLTLKIIHLILWENQRIYQKVDFLITNVRIRWSKNGKFSKILWSITQAYLTPLKHCDKNFLEKCRSSCPEVFWGILRTATLLKKTLAQVFSCKFCEISKNTF